MLCSAKIGSRYDAARAGNHAPTNEAATPSPNEVSTRSACILGATAVDTIPYTDAAMLPITRFAPIAR